MNTHFTFSDRVKIQYSLETNPYGSASQLAKDLSKSRSAIYYELKTNTTRYPSTASKFTLRIQTQFLCPLLAKFPFCCSGCSKTRCSHRNSYYDAANAHIQATETLKKSRSQIKRIKKNVEVLEKHLCPLILQGQSIHVAMSSLKECDLHESTIRRYINDERLSVRRIDLPQAVRFRPKKMYQRTSTATNVRILMNRTYDDFKRHLLAHPNAVIIQCDSVMGKRTDHTALLTIFFVNSKFQIAINYRRANSKVKDILLNLYEACRQEGFTLFDTILTDNGGEFQSLVTIENDEQGVQRFKVFYCDPYCSYQKAECERNHGFIRRIFSKQTSFDTINQQDIDTSLSHINSYPRGSLKGLTPYECFTQEYSVIIADILKIQRIDRNKLTLKKK